MPIDTAEKRRSAAGVAFFVVGPGVTPTASKDVEWRQQSAWSYSGIAVQTGIFVRRKANWRNASRSTWRI